jgi:hypothetical protein
MQGRYFINGQPTRCAFCGEPFRIWEGHLEAWRVGDEYTCDVFCASALQEQAEQLPETSRR